MKVYAAADSQDIEEEDEYENAELEDASEDFVLPSNKWREECSNLIPRLIASCDITIPSSNQCVYFGSHTGTINAIQDAIENIILGKFDRCIVGGIDSCIEPRFLVAAAAREFSKPV